MYRYSSSQPPVTNSRHCHRHCQLHVSRHLSASGSSHAICTSRRQQLVSAHQRWRELLAFQTDSKVFQHNVGLEFWTSAAAAEKYPLLAPLAQDLLSAPASQAYVK